MSFNIGHKSSQTNIQLDIIKVGGIDLMDLLLLLQCWCQSIFQPIPVKERQVGAAHQTSATQANRQARGPPSCTKNVVFARPDPRTAPGKTNTTTMNVLSKEFVSSLSIWDSHCPSL